MVINVFKDTLMLLYRWLLTCLNIHSCCFIDGD